MNRGHLRECVIAGVLYAEDFDHAPIEARAVRSVSASIDAEPSPLTPSFSLDELQAAVHQAYQDGREFERQNRQDLMEQQLAVSVSDLRTQIVENEKRASLMIESGLSDIARMSLTMIATALPTLSADHAENEVRLALQQIMPAARRMPELTIRMHPSLRETVERAVGAALDQTMTRVTWNEADTMLRGDIMVSWQNGTAFRDTEATCVAIRNSVIGLFRTINDSRPTGQQHGQ